MFFGTGAVPGGVDRRGCGDAGRAGYVGRLVDHRKLIGGAVLKAILRPVDNVRTHRE